MIPIPGTRTFVAFDRSSSTVQRALKQSKVYRALRMTSRCLMLAALPLSYIGGITTAKLLEEETLSPSVLVAAAVFGTLILLGLLVGLIARIFRAKAATLFDEVLTSGRAVKLASHTYVTLSQLLHTTYGLTLTTLLMFDAEGHLYHDVLWSYVSEAQPLEQERSEKRNIHVIADLQSRLTALARPVVGEIWQVAQRVDSDDINVVEIELTKHLRVW